MYILLVTWLVANQPATSYQVQFSDQATCETARAALMDESGKLRQEQLQYEARVQATMAASTITPGRAPEVVVVCAKQ